jgi:hypothetical protein
MSTPNPVPTDPIAFIDMAKREAEERARLAQRKFELEERKQDNGGVLEPELAKELADIDKKLQQERVVDPLFRAIVKDMAASSRPVGDHKQGLLPSQQAQTGTAGNLTGNEKALAAVYGILELDNHTNPGVRFTAFNSPVTAGGTAPQPTAAAAPAAAAPTRASGRKATAPAAQPAAAPTPRQPAAAAPVAPPSPPNAGEEEIVVSPELKRRFAVDLARAHGEYNADRDLFEAVLPILVKFGDRRTTIRPTNILPVVVPPVTADAVRAHDWASVVRTLRARGVKADDIHLELAVQRALAGQGGIDDGAPPSSIDIVLPELETFADVEIIADNLKAMQALYFSAMLEDLRMFQVVDKLVELFQLGQLPLGKGTAGDLLYGYWKKAVNRMSEIERRNLYGRAFGFPGGEPTFGNPNREFTDLWLRFVSAVSSFRRQLTVDELLRSSIPVTVSEEQVRKSGRDLAANMSLHGYGVAYFAAAELQNQVREIISLLSDPEIKNSYGSRDMFQVVDQVATLELGGARNSVRYRTMADSGAIIIRWLANRADLLASSSRAPLINRDEIRDRPPTRPPGSSPTVDPTDRDLVEACERWLAVTGTPDARVEEYAQPTETPMITSRPVQIPTVARDLLESYGVGMPSTNGARGVVPA